MSIYAARPDAFANTLKCYRALPDRNGIKPFPTVAPDCCKLLVRSGLEPADAQDRIRASAGFSLSMMRSAGVTQRTQLSIASREESRV